MPQYPSPQAPLSAPLKPQYHYFYGSIEEGDEDEDDRKNLPDSPATDGDSLVGESLVHTDNEEETPNNSEHDFQQLLVSTNGKGLLPVQDPTRPKPWFQHLSFKQVRENRAVLFLLFLVFTLIIVIVVVVLDNADFSGSASQVAVPASEKAFQIPFDIVDRADYGDPVENFLVTTLMHPSLRDNESSHTFKVPFPTGAFWTNLVLPSTADRGLSYPIAVYPYAYKWNDNMIQVSYPARHRKEEPKAIHDYFFPDLSIGTVETMASRFITAFDPLSVTLQYATNETDSLWASFLVQGSPYVTMRFRNVSPTIRAFSTFQNVLCPRDDSVSIGTGEDLRRRLKFGVCSTTTSGDLLTLRGIQFLLQTPEGMNWIVFASEPISLVYDTRTRTTIQASEPFRGVLRLAYIPTVGATTKSDDFDVFSSTGLQRLIYHAGVYPVSGSVSWSFQSGTTESTLAMAAKTISSVTGSVSGAMETPPQTTSSPVGRSGSIQFAFDTRLFAPSSSAATKAKPLLMLALPHHAQSLPVSTQLSRDLFDLAYVCIKGPMRPVLGSTWSYTERLPSLGFDGGTGASKNASVLRQPEVRSTLLKTLAKDVKLALPTKTENVYGFGKQAARLAQLVHIASRLIETGTAAKTDDASSSSAPSPGEVDAIQRAYNESLSSLRDALQSFLAGDVSDAVVYDASLGGIVSTDGLRNTEADFGNGRYNDHHFHYGYVLYACAVLGRLDPSFVALYGEQVDALFYDVAHFANFDSKGVDGAFFPGARHKVWFDGHSYASGLFPFGNGKSQESSSEAVNCYYGAYLWSLVRHNATANPDADTSTMTDFARLLLATEIRGAKTYWQMTPPSNGTKSDTSMSVYSPAFAQNYMVGNIVSSLWLRLAVVGDIRGSHNSNRVCLMLFAARGSVRRACTCI